MKTLQQQIAEIVSRAPLVSMETAAEVMKLIRAKQEREGCPVKVWWAKQPIMGLKYGPL